MKLKQLNEATPVAKQKQLKLSPEATRAIETQDFERAYASVGMAQEEQDYVINEYFKVEFSDPATVQKVQPFKDFIVKLLLEAGFDNNPFMKFLDNFFKANPTATLTRDNFIGINNMFARNVIRQNNLESTVDNILLNPTLYKQSNKEIAGIVRAFNWFNINEKKINLKDTAAIAAALKLGSTDKLPATAKDLRDAVIFVDGNPAGQINPAKQIEGALNDLLAGKVINSETPADIPAPDTQAQQAKPQVGEKMKQVKIPAPPTQSEIKMWDRVFAQSRIDLKNPNTVPNLLAYFEMRGYLK